MTSAPGQTVGPFFHLGLAYEGSNVLVPPSDPAAIRLHGVVLDGEGQPVPDALIEIWQTGPDGAVIREPGSLRRDGFTFTGFGRAQTDADGHYWFSTLEPARFFAVTVFARGLLDRLFTRAYLPESAGDPFLSGVSPERRATLVAVREPRGLRFDLRLQGESETVFLTFGETA
jgi:protocatechuate 3,4-dioxygenase, alpha subunit